MKKKDKQVNWYSVFCLLACYTVVRGKKQELVCFFFRYSNYMYCRFIIFTAKLSRCNLGVLFLRLITAQTRGCFSGSEAEVSSGMFTEKL